MPKYVALLRGVNIGGHHKLPMKDLCAMFTDVGCTGVRNYIQSGNVVFSCRKSARSICGRITSEIEKKFGFAPAIMVRTADELAMVIRENPFLKKGAAPEELHVSFLSRTPSADEITKLDQYSFPPEEFAVQGNHLYLRLPNGMGQAKLARVPFDAKLNTVGTARNWRTVTTLFAMMSESD